jgi:hypothetical protein
VFTGVPGLRAVIEDLIAAMDKFPSTTSLQDKNELIGAPLIPGPASSTLRTTAAVGIVGSAIAAPVYVNLYWDSSWDADNSANPREAFDSYLQAVVGSSYFAGLAQYGITTPAFGGSFLPNPACTQVAPAPSVGFYDPVNPSIIGFLQCELDNDTSLPQGDSVIYNIILPNTSTENDAITGLFGKVPFCVPDPTTLKTVDAWHFHGSPYSTGDTLGGVLGFIIGGFVGDPVQGAIVGFLLALSQQGAPFYTISSASVSPNCHNLTDNVVHEMIEATSNPSPSLNVITSGTGEIADLCEPPTATPSPSWVPNSKPLPAGVTLNPGGFLMVSVPQYQSNAIGACIPGYGSMSTPNIQNVTLTGTFPGTSMDITGSGFGTIPPPFGVPTSANLPYFGVQNMSENWQAGNSLNSNNVGVTITSWTDGEIKTLGFSPAPVSGAQM